MTDRVTDKIPAVSSERDKFSRNIRLVNAIHILSDIDLLIGMELF